MTIVGGIGHALVKANGYILVFFFHSKIIVPLMCMLLYASIILRISKQSHSKQKMLFIGMLLVK